MFESGHLTLVSGAGEGEVVSKKVGKEVRGKDEWTKVPFCKDEWTKVPFCAHKMPTKEKFVKSFPRILVINDTGNRLIDFDL